MHTVSLPEQVHAAVAARRGRALAYESYEPRRTALLVVDMQNHFVAEGGFSEVPLARGIVSNINDVASAMRLAGGTVVWVYSTFTHEGRSSWPMFFENFIAPDRQHEVRSALTEGSWGHQFYPGLDVAAPDLKVTKDRFSPFIAGASVLHDTLQDRGIDTVVVAGTMTDVCCESTARDAMMLDYRTIMIEDACAARSDESHVAALTSFASVFGDVRRSVEIVDVLSSAPSTSLPAPTT
jgi:ureidoacrylate peracid hydrolase